MFESIYSDGNKNFYNIEPYLIYIESFNKVSIINYYYYNNNTLI